MTFHSDSERGTIVKYGDVRAYVKGIDGENKPIKYNCRPHSGSLFKQNTTTTVLCNASYNGIDTKQVSFSVTILPFEGLDSSFFISIMAIIVIFVGIVIVFLLLQKRKRRKNNLQEMLSGLRVW